MVRIVEVGCRDGLQNIKQTVPTQTKIELLQRLATAGLRHIEATSFVSPKWVPQLADGPEVMRAIRPAIERGDVQFPVLTPNLKGLENAIKSQAREVAVFGSAGEGFSKANQNCSVDEGLEMAEKVVSAAVAANLMVRGSVSCIFSDPYDGPVPAERVHKVAKRLLDAGCYEILLGDTMGVGSSRNTKALLEHLLKTLPANKLAGHFHDTYGQAVSNVFTSYEMGLRTFDSSVAGLGGCPFAPGARGNVATEDLVYAFETSGISTGVNLDSLVDTGEWISEQLGIPYGSRAGHALAQKRRKAKVSVAEPLPPAPTSSPTPTRKWKELQDNGDFKVQRDGNVLRITLTNAKRGNVLTPNLVNNLTQVFKKLRDDKSIFHVVLSAEGRYFCTGMDLSAGSEDQPKVHEDGQGHFASITQLFDAIENAHQTTIALINGPCYGGGVGLGFACDIRLASPIARWTLSEIKLGVAPAIISPYIVREWGPSFSKGAMLTGRPVTVQELYSIGAVHGIADGDRAEDLERLLDSNLVQLQKCAPQAAVQCKELIKMGSEISGTTQQRDRIREIFGNMAAPGAEGRFGIEQFQKGVKNVDWSAYWSTRSGRSHFV